MAKPPKPVRSVESLVHADTRRNIPTAEFQSLAQQAEEIAPLQPAHYRRATPLPAGETRARDTDRDPQLLWRGVRIRLTQAQRAQLQETGEVELGDAQLVWRGKDQQDWSDLIVTPPPIYIQEKVHPKAIIDGLRKQARARARAADDTPDLFADFNGLTDPEARLEFYQHDQHWSNRMILGDSLQVMASLAEREGLRGRVQCIYFDPPYGIKFNSNWQVSTLSRDVKDGKREDVSREPEQVKAFRDTWKDGIHSYLTYLRDRLTVARELLTDSGSVFVQIGDENVHRVRSVLDEVLGAENAVSDITFQKTGGQTSDYLSAVQDYVLWYAKRKGALKFRRLFYSKEVGVGHGSGARYDQIGDDGRTFQLTSLTSNRPPGSFPVSYCGRDFGPSGGYWKTGENGFSKLLKADRIRLAGRTLRYVRYVDDFAAYPITNIWTDVAGSPNKIYVVQTSSAVVERCLLMASDPGDLVLDPTCGSGTTIAIAEQWGRRWITIDTSRVALALARTRLMAAKYPYYLLADSRDGRAREQEVSGKPAPDTPTHHDVRHGFVYERAPHVTLKSIANNAEIDVIWERWQATLEPLREALNAALGRGAAPDPSWPAVPTPSLRAAPPSLRAEGEAIQGPPAPSARPLDRRAASAARDDEITPSLRAEGEVIQGPPAPSVRPLDRHAASAARDGEITPSLRAEGEAIQRPPAPSAAIQAAARAATPGNGVKPWEEWQIPREAGEPWPAKAADLWRALREANPESKDAARLLSQLNQSLGRDYTRDTVPDAPRDPWPEEPTRLHAAWWQARIARQKEIDASIARKADIEFLYDRPYEDKARVRVAGPFTVESLSPHRVVPADEDELLGHPGAARRRAGSAPPQDFAAIVLEHLRTAGVHQSRRADSLHFTSLAPWPGEYIGAEGRYLEGETERRAAILIGPEYGTLTRMDLVTAAREASEARFDALIACAFSYDAHASELTKLGPLPILKARMNPDLHMAADLKNTGRGNLFVVFGEPDISWRAAPEPADHIVIQIHGVDVFDPQTGEIRSGDTKSIAAWFIDTDYNEESFYVRHAYFLGANDPYKSLKAALRAEIDEEAWATLYRDVSRPFERPEAGRVAVKVINHFGDEVMKVFSVG